MSFAVGAASQRLAFLGLCLAFFLSGFAALIDQIVWQRMLGLFAGSDSVTAALVVGAFLLGLGLGSLAAGAVTDRLGMRAALIGFVLCEIGIGIFGLLSRPFLYDFVVQVIGPLVPNRWGIFAVCFGGILIPTMLMGASLPLLAKAAINSLAEAAPRIGWLYGLNTLGAGLGALLGGWWLIGTLGYENSLRVAALFNLLAAAIGLLLWRLEPAGKAAAPALAATAPAAIATRGFGFGIWALLVFVSGFAIVALEILWVRVAGVVAQYTAYSFATILGSFLLADGLGMVLGALWLKRLRDTRAAFFAVQALATLYALGSIWLVYWLAGAVWWESLLAAETTRHYGTPLFAALVVTVLLVAPPSLLLGISFPLAQQAVQTDLSRLGWRVAAVQVANILGNAAGSLATGLVALHWLGTAGTLKFIALLAVLLLLYWAYAAWRERQPGAWRFAAGLAAVLAVALALFPGNTQFWARLHQAAEQHEILVAEDRSGLALFRLNENGAASPFFIQGFTQSKWPFMVEHAFLGAVGPLLHPAPADVLVIGSGSGGTPFAAGVNPATQRVRVVELVGPVFQVLRDFAVLEPDSAIAGLLRDPRYEFVVGDGRRAIFAAERRYNVIQADAILPESSHSGLLYSREFMQMVLAALADDGIYVQWGPTARSVATFAAVFPHVAMLQPFPVLIGSRHQLDIDHDRLRAVFGSEAARRHFAAAGIDTGHAERLFHQAVLRAPQLDTGAGVNADLFPRDEYYINNQLGAATKTKGGS
ncbi:fused MFS/spermidine synthase [Ferrovibrio sp.]|uniref:fused MFS/spermidine synthase n=1 Tax=Ferrovibrio sp. TaxID=1917215 RepID=UPI001B4775E9|nr:fused MFS/spermidine synthase [Ferrovibrio sp.]MBP7063963.1 fused MFS/spermidine synthase [Ferrovibrio sp.]